MESLSLTRSLSLWPQLVAAAVTFRSVADRCIASDAARQRRQVAFHAARASMGAMNFASAVLRTRGATRPSSPRARVVAARDCWHADATVGGSRRGRQASGDPPSAGRPGV